MGSLLRKAGLTEETYLKTSDKLVYYIFFPILLFWKIGGSSHQDAIEWPFILAALLALGLMFMISTLVIRFGPVSSFEAGSFSQSCYRFNTYIGVAVVLNSLGEEGIALFGILIAIAIPLINVFAVATLIWFSDGSSALRKRFLLVAKAVVANPLIIGCLLGLIYGRLFSSFPVFIDNSLQLISMVTLPLALVSIGGSLSFRGLKKHLSLSFMAASLKLLVLPVSGYMMFQLFEVSGISFKVGMIFFCLPASTAIYVLSSQLNSDTELASAAILVSTLLSFISLSVALLL
ncbi:MAG: AEC family transporter [Desulfobacterales bacterium]|nr:AEC family transporter [Desulfobacterales bacterium]